MRYFHKLLISTLCIITIGISQTNYSVSFEYMDGYASSDASSETIDEFISKITITNT